MMKKYFNKEPVMIEEDNEDFENLIMIILIVMLK